MGMTDLAYQRTLIFEQRTRIVELELIWRHLARGEEELSHVLASLQGMQSCAPSPASNRR